MHALLIPFFQTAFFPPWRRLFLAPSVVNRKIFMKIETFVKWKAMASPSHEYWIGEYEA